MNRNLRTVFAGLFGLALLTLSAIPGFAQAQEVKSKPPMYSYIANWQIPRAHWSEMPQTEAADKSIMDKALADGTIIGHGDDETLVHTPDGETHDDWWSSMSMAGLLKVLNQLYASGNTSSPALDAATKHWDLVYVSHYYNWHPGAYKSAYTYVSEYELKPDAPGDAVDTISKNVVVPLLEKMLADGTLIEYEIDELSVHTQAPGTFSIVYLTPTPDGIDKIEAAIHDAIKDQPLIVPAFGSMTKASGHRDELFLSEGIYK
jgi:hypothetical protein